MRPWSEYPPGTKAFASMGGHWEKRRDGRWQWPGGGSFPTPGGDAVSVLEPRADAAARALENGGPDESALGGGGSALSGLLRGAGEGSGNQEGER